VSPLRHVLSDLASIAVVVGVCVPLQRELIHLRIHLSGLGVLHELRTVLSRDVLERIFSINHGVAVESLLQLSGLGVELVVVVPFVAHLDVLPASEAHGAKKAQYLEKSDFSVQVDALRFVC